MLSSVGWGCETPGAVVIRCGAMEEEIMGRSGTILVGTVGQGVMSSSNDGESWGRAGVNQGLHSDCIVRTLVLDPSHPETVYAGTDMGLYRSEDKGSRWQLLETPMRGKVMWTLAIDPTDPDVMFAGIGTPSRPGIYRSTDGGKSWEQRPMEIADTCPAVDIPRPTGIAIDPTNPRSIWVGIEVDGVRHSTDGGDTWAKVDGGMDNLDVHNVLVVASSPTRVFTVVNDDVWTSTDDGATRKAAGARTSFPWHYPPRHSSQAGRPSGRVSDRWRYNAGPHRDGHAHAGCRGDLGNPFAPRAAQLGDVDGKYAPSRARCGVRCQSLRLPVSE